MKKLFLILIILLLVGCSNQKENLYYQYVEDVNKCVYFINEEYPFNIDIALERLNDDYIMYSLYIDNSNEDLYDIKAMIIHDYETNDVFPSSGLYEEPLDLITNTKSSDYIKGIILSGYIETKENIEDLNITFRALIKARSKLGYYKEYCYVKAFE